MPSKNSNCISSTMIPSDDEEDVAPIYTIPPREIIAIEHPMIIQNLDNGLKTFGKNRPFKRIIECADPEECLPIYLRINDPMCTPILSHNSPTNNVLLKITVPKRTGRKRKRGSQDPYTDPIGTVEKYTGVSTLGLNRDTLMSHSRNDKPSKLLRRLRDNETEYSIEVMGEVANTHRYRGLSDFHQSTSKSQFFSKFESEVLSGTVDSIREYKFNPSKGVKLMEDILPAPLMTHHALPFNWGWHQNPHIAHEVDAKTGEVVLINKSKPTVVKMEYLKCEIESIPQRASNPPPNDPDLLGLIGDLQDAMDERPVWTRRALTNRVSHSKVLFLMRQAIQYVGYQFKGGPFRDAIIKYGVDPRGKKKYRKYQTFVFKIYEEEEKVQGMMWKDVRTTYQITKRGGIKADDQTHIFDGKRLTLDGKIWQACDITDPLLAHLLQEAPYRDECEVYSDGWYQNGTVAKIKAIMKVKLIAIRLGKNILDEEFEAALDIADDVPGRTSSQVGVPVPDIRLTPEEVEELKQRGIERGLRSSGVRKGDHGGKPRIARIRDRVGTQRHNRGSSTRPKGFRNHIPRDNTKRRHGGHIKKLAQHGQIVEGRSQDQTLDTIEEENAEDTDPGEVEEEHEGSQDDSDIDEVADTGLPEVEDDSEQNSDSDATVDMDYRQRYGPSLVARQSEA